MQRWPRSAERRDTKRRTEQNKKKMRKEAKELKTREKCSPTHPKSKRILKFDYKGK